MKTIYPNWVYNLIDDITSLGLVNTKPTIILKMITNKIEEENIPVDRMSIGNLVIHPLLCAETYQWVKGSNLITSENKFKVELNEIQMKESPFIYMRKNNIKCLDTRLNSEKYDFPHFTNLLKDGFIHYISFFKSYDTQGLTIDTENQNIPEGLICSYCSKSDNGFTIKEKKILEKISLYLSISIRPIHLLNMTKIISESYLGRITGRKVLSGEMTRGNFELIDSIILFGDFKNFTNITEKNNYKKIINSINYYYEIINNLVTSNKGEILKFMGDGFLAIFNLKEHDNLYKKSYDTAKDIIKQVNNSKYEKLINLKIDLALHLGKVCYGNIGSNTRLDFTVIGQAVNEASRIEKICDKLNINLLLSEKYLMESSLNSQDFNYHGAFKLKGVDNKIIVYSPKNII